MLFKISALVILAAFYSFYIAKLIIQKKQSIRTNQMGKGNNKPQKVVLIEKIMSAATCTVIAAEVISIFAVTAYDMTLLRIIGIILGISAVIIFAMATVTMKTSWRVGIPEEKTALVTSGIYSISRNPAFVAFDMLYCSVCLMFFNIPLLILSVFAAVMLHLQILQEEEFMHNTFGSEYDEYRKHTMRYLGRR